MNDVRRRFVILFVGRSGSTFLQTTLDGHPRIRADGERFAGKGPRTQVDEMRAFLEGGHPEVCVGFKIKHRDVKRPNQFSAMLSDLDVPLIALLRRNTVKQAVSHANAVRLHAATGQWNRLTDSTAGPALGRFAIDPEQLRGDVERITRERDELVSFVGEAGRPTLLVHYEDLLEDPSPAFGMVHRFLDVPPLESRAGTAKNTPDRLSDVLENLDELRDAFHGTRYERMFDDPTVAATPTPVAVS